MIDRESKTIAQLEKQLNESRSNVHFLAESANKILLLKDISETFQLGLDSMYRIMDNQGVVIAVEFNGDNWFLRGYRGIGKFARNVSQLLGFPLDEMHSQVNTSIVQPYTSGKLLSIKHDVLNLTNGLISDSTVQKIKTFFNLRNMHCISFQQNQETYGMFTFLTNLELKEMNHDLIEGLSSQLSFVLKKQKIDSLLRISEEKYKTVVDNTSEGIFIIKDMKCLYANPAIEALTGYRLSELGNYTLIDMVHKDDHSLIIDNYSKRIKGENIPPYDIRIKRKDGKTVWGSLNASLINWGNEKAVLYLVRDNTKRIAAEKELSHNLEEKKELLQELFHRTKNNMQVIISMMSIKSRHFRNDDVQQVFKEISSKIRIMALAQQKLYLSHDLTSIRLDEYIDEIINMMRMTYVEDSDKVSVETQFDKIAISIDKALPLGMLINELTSNAIKHGFAGGIKGEIKIELFEDLDGKINIKFKDNGIGLSPGMNLREINSLGLQNVFFMILHQLRGEVDYKSEGGLSWHIRFKDEARKTKF